MYKKRIIEDLINEKLAYTGAVLIEGAKYCGKTSTAEQLSKSRLYMQDPDYTERNLALAKTQPSILLDGENPRLIDEWQLAPNLWNAVRHSVDMRKEKGLYILTGSSSIQWDSSLHTGTGRIARILMRPMSLFESGDSCGSISLSDLFENRNFRVSACNLKMEDIAYLIMRGGWPESIGLSEKIAAKKCGDYVENIANVDICTIDGIRRSPTKVKAFLRSLARNISTSASLNSIIKDTEHEDELMDEKTAATYRDALERLFIIEDLPAWTPSLRAKTPIRTVPTRHFVDPSIACACLGATSENMLKDYRSFGLLFESLCIRDLRIYAESLDGTVSHFRNANGLEADAIIHLHDGKWAAVEVKLGLDKIDEAARNLIKLSNMTQNKPSFLLIITSVGAAYQREDGVFVVPIGCLKN
jgi:Predicted ATPase (AAA+ superfamily)